MNLISILLFFVTLIVSFTVVQIGAIAFQVTGLEWPIAKFQALSCFSGTGFTTKEAELIVKNPQRRRIATTLMVLGKAGFVTLIATFANSLHSTILPEKILIPFAGVRLPAGVTPWVNFIIILLISFIIFRIYTHTRLASKIVRFLRRRVVKEQNIKNLTFDDLLISTGGYGISTVEIFKNNLLIGKTLQSAKLRKEHDIIILAIERKREVIPNPPLRTRIQANDKLVCFGKMDTLKEKFYEQLILPTDKELDDEIQEEIKSTQDTVETKNSD